MRKASKRQEPLAVQLNGEELKKVNILSTMHQPFVRVARWESGLKHRLSQEARVMGGLV